MGAETVTPGIEPGATVYKTVGQPLADVIPTSIRPSIFWLARLGSNQHSPDSKSGGLPLPHAPVAFLEVALGIEPSHIRFAGGPLTIQDRHLGVPDGNRTRYYPDHSRVPIH